MGVAVRSKLFTTGSMFGSEAGVQLRVLGSALIYCTEGHGPHPLPAPCSSHHRERRKRKESNGGIYFNILSFALSPSVYVFFYSQGPSCFSGCWSSSHPISTPGSRDFKIQGLSLWPPAASVSFKQLFFRIPTSIGA